MRRVTREAARGTAGMVACQHRIAAAAGADVLTRGGNAIDAAVTAALVLSVVEPWLSGLGGGGFLVRADIAGETSALDFNMVSAAALDTGRYPIVTGRDGDWFDWPSVEDDRNLVGFDAIGVPGAVAGLAAALERFGTISFADALVPAIAEAERGLEIDWFAALCLAIDAAGLARFPASRATFLVDGAAPRPAERGDPVRLPMTAMARTLRRLADEGAASFYAGGIAEGLVGDLAAGGSAVSAGDLARYAPRWTDALQGDYRGHRVVTMPGASGGPALLDWLGRLESEPEYARGGAPSASDHAIAARALRAVYEVRLTRQGHGGSGGDCTTHVSAIDRHGTAVSLTNTLLSRFGSKVVLPGSGLLMNNAMMWFDPRPGQPNSMAPDTRPLANMCPIVVTRNALPWLSLGAAGGRQIFPAVGQILSSLVDFGSSLEDAFHTPRIDASTPVVQVDRRAPPDTAAVIARDVPVAVVDDDLYPVRFAIPSAVRRLDTGEFEGMVHPVHPWGAAVAGG